MQAWFKGIAVLYSTPESRRSGLLSVLAVIEMVVAVMIYWWIAKAYETQIHIFISLIVAPMYLLRSDKSVAKAQKLWDFCENKKDSYSKQAILEAFVVAIISLLLSALSVGYLQDYQSWWLFGWGALFGWLMYGLIIYTALSILPFGFEKWRKALAVFIIFSVVPATFFYEHGWFAGFGAFVGLIVFSYMPSSVSGFWSKYVIGEICFGVGRFIRSLLIRFFSVFSSLKVGGRSFPYNWKRVTLYEDLMSPPELIPGVEMTTIYRFETHWVVLKNLYKIFPPWSQKLSGFSRASIFLAPIWFLSGLIWRFSLKSTAWFYLPIFLMSKPGELNDPQTRKLYLTSEPPLSRTLVFILTMIGLIIAFVAAINFVLVYDLWSGLHGEAPFSPIAWLLVIDWGRFIDEPWKWFSMPAAILTVLIYLRVDSIRKLRDGMHKNGIDPDQGYNVDGFVGASIYWMDKARNVLVIMSFLVGLWYFTKMAYFDHQLTHINPWLASIFGPLN